MVATVFVLTSLAWIFQPQLKTFIPAANDTSIAMAAALALFIIPVDARKRVFLMNWEHAGKVPWGILLLFGGGSSLATVIGSTGLAEWIASALGGLSMMEGIMLMALIVAVITFLTEVTSNTATAAATSCRSWEHWPYHRACRRSFWQFRRDCRQLCLHDAGGHAAQRHRVRHKPMEIAR